MIKNLSKHGDNLALVIDRSILDQLNIDEATPLEVTTDGQSLIVAPIRDEARRKQFEQALGAANSRFGETLKRLAE